MDFQAISDIFGGTIFPQDYRIDISKAREKISEREKAHVSDAGSSEGQLLLLKAVLYSITGDLAKYEWFLLKAKEIADAKGDDHLSLRCCAYLKYGHWLTRASPPLDFWSDYKAETEDFDELFLRYRGLSLDVNENIDLNRKIVGRFGSPSVAEIESKVLLWSWHLTRMMWVQGYHHHPDYPCHPALRNLGKTFNAMVDTSWRDSDVRKVSRKLLKTATFMKRAKAESHLAGNDPDQASIADLIQDCEKQGDQIGVANLELLNGDRMYSHPWTSPLALNLMLHASGLAWNNDFEESCKGTENKRSENEFILAEDFYQKAFQIFEKEGCYRGMGASRLRSACIRSRNLLDAIMSPHTICSSDESSKKQMFDKAFQLLKEALTLFELDEANTCIARTHELLLEIFQGKDMNETMLRKASSIGVWGREKGNPRISRFAGMLLLRAGKMISDAPDHAEMTRACCVCAKIIFHRLEEPLMEGRASASQAIMYQKLGNLSLAREKVMLSCDILINARQWFLRAVRSDDQRRFDTMWINLAESFEKGFMTIFKGNNHLLKEWEHKLSDLRGSHVNGPERQTEDFIEKIASFLPIKTRDQKRKALQEWGQARSSQSRDVESRRQELNNIFHRREAIMQHDSNTDKADLELKKIFQSSANSSDLILLNLNKASKVVALALLGKFDESRKFNLDLVPSSLGGRGISFARSLTSEAQSMKLDACMPLFSYMQAKESRMVVQICFHVKDWNLGKTVLVKAIGLQPTFFDDLKNDTDSYAYETMVALAAIKRNTGYLKEAFEWYILALNGIEQNREILSDVEDRKKVVLPTFFHEAFSGLASIYLECEDSEFNELNDTKSINVLWRHFGLSREDRALACLEQGRSRALLDLLRLKGNTLAYRTWLYDERLSQIEGKGLSAGPQHPVLQGSDADYRSIKAEVKREDDLKGLTKALSRIHFYQHAVDAANPYEFIPQDSVAISINIDRQKTNLFYITNVGIQRYHKGSMTSYELSQQVSGFLKLFRELKNPNHCPEEARYAPYLTKLSDLIILPAEDIISRSTHVIFVVSQSLNKFPLSALYFRNKPLFLSKEVSSCPSLTVLENLRTQANHRKINCGGELLTSMIFAAPPEVAQIESAEEEPVEAERTEPSNEDPLDISAASVMHISSRFGCQALAAEKITPEEFGKTFSKSDILLIATHGRQPDQDRLIQNPSAWEYDVLLAGPDGPSFRVVDLVKWESRAALVVFEACISGLVEESVGVNESLGFSHMVLASGANAFIGAMWKVSDLASALLMFLFLEEIAMARKNIGKSVPLSSLASDKRRTLASCFRSAQIALYNTNKQAAMKMLEQFQESCRCDLRDDGLNDHQREKIRDSLEFAMEEVDEGNADEDFLFRNPFFVAPFVLVGNGAYEV